MDTLLPSWIVWALGKFRTCSYSNIRIILSSQIVFDVVVTHTHGERERESKNINESIYFKFWYLSYFLPLNWLWSVSVNMLCEMKCVRSECLCGILLGMASNMNVHFENQIQNFRASYTEWTKIMSHLAQKFRFTKQNGREKNNNKTAATIISTTKKQS